ncbi:hypothetical protein [Polaribacter cellanae]|uniref:DUF4369 domain-containing protein n=1 Tax=Polaribacter cellanae TaxID=2818493 RepID=A0A975CP33_9FLAO|nr:hypothetical protein [Polaribacter cellanae]QTE22765.1 hypothetical protein J3359_00340 [Polaribacter cellanae]
MKIIMYLFFILISLTSFSQEEILIKGKLFFSDNFYETFPNLLVKLDSSSKYIQIKEDGKFEIKTPIKKESYQLFFYYGNIKFKEFDYKFKWTKRKKPKSISLAEKCEVNKSLVKRDFKKGKMKLYFFKEDEKVKLTDKDRRIQKEYFIEYIQFPLSEIINYDCYLDYNQRVFKFLFLIGKKKYLDKINNNVIGYHYRYNITK